MAEFEGMEIPEELLDAIAGGVMTDETKGAIRKIARNGKLMGLTFDEVSVFVRIGANGYQGPGNDYTADEAIEYMASIWDEE